MNYAGLVVSYDLILKCMKKIFDYQKNKLHGIKRRYKLFINIYNNFKQTLGVQNQQSDNNKKFYFVITCQFIALM